jgi:hypothetical protein
VTQDMFELRGDDLEAGMKSQLSDLVSVSDRH